MILLKKNYNAKITNTEGMIPSITDLFITAALNTVTNKIRKVSDILKKTDYDPKLSE